MSRENIEKYSFGYRLLHEYGMFTFKKFFKISYIHKDKIPKNEHIILAPNHQNALMDALAPLMTKRWQPVFLARADIFKKKFIASLLTFIKILPVYRIRDGYGELQKNDQIFRKTIDVVKSKNPLFILPEGNHDGHKKLRPLKKGICRIAFQTEEANDFKLNIKIVPVGLDYSNYIKFGSKLNVIFGDPIPVSNYYELYKENQQKALNALKNEISEGIKKVMIHIEDLENHDTYIRTIEINRNEQLKKMNLSASPYHNFLADKETVNILSESIEKVKLLEGKTARYFKNIDELKLRPWVFNKDRYNFGGLFLEFLWLLITFPIFIFGFITNILSFWFPTQLTKKLKDPQFVSSIRYGVGIIVSFPIVYITALVLGLVFLPVWWLSFILIFMMVITGIFAYHYYRWFKKWFAKLRYNLGFNKKLLQETKELRSEILDTI